LDTAAAARASAAGSRGASATAPLIDLLALAAPMTRVPDGNLGVRPTGEYAAEIGLIGARLAPNALTGDAMKPATTTLAALTVTTRPKLARRIAAPATSSLLSDRENFRINWVGRALGC
jgi:hypothetical protein